MSNMVDISGLVSHRLGVLFKNKQRLFSLYFSTVAVLHTRGAAAGSAGEFARKSQNFAPARTDAHGADWGRF